MRGFVARQFLSSICSNKKWQEPLFPRAYPQFLLCKKDMILSRLNNGSSVLVCLFTVYVVSKWYPSSAFSASQSPASAVRTASFSAVVEPRGSQATTMERLERLWNDPRPISQVIGNDDDLQRERKDDGDSALPYCLSTGTFEAAGCKFEVLIYPRGILDRADVGTAAAYLKFRPESPGNEADIGWTLRLVDGRTGKALPIFTSGGLPRSADTWSSAMTFTSRFEAADSVGRTADWGASTWSADDIVNSLSGPGTQLKVEGIISLYGVRDGESTFSWPLGQKGALGAIRKAAKESGSRERGQRTFRSGEVIVPTKVAAPDKIKQMEEAGIFPGVDYRVMTISDAGGNAIFSTDRLPTVEERESARLALRPVGWRLNQKKWMERGKKVTDWPVEVPANLLSTSALTRFNFEVRFFQLSAEHNHGVRTSNSEKLFYLVCADIPAATLLSVCPRRVRGFNCHCNRHCARTPCSRGKAIYLIL